MRWTLIAALLLTGCGSRELTKSKAAALIRESYPRSIEGPMQIGSIGTDAGSMEDYLQSPNGRMSALEQEAGLVSLRWQNGDPNRVHITFTQRGLALVGRQSALIPRMPENSPHMASVKMCEFQFVEVTGIALRSEGLADVQYTVKKDNLTPFGKGNAIAYGPTAPPCGDSPLQTFNVAMRVYDDGWRISQ